MQAIYNIGDFVSIKSKTFNSVGNKVFEILEIFVWTNTYKLNNGKIYNYDELLLVETKEDSLDRLEEEKERQIKEGLKQVVDFFT